VFSKQKSTWKVQGFLTIFTDSSPTSFLVFGSTGYSHLVHLELARRFASIAEREIIASLARNVDRGMTTMDVEIHNKYES
jgi:hypothetical protein